MNRETYQKLVEAMEEVSSCLESLTYKEVEYIGLDRFHDHIDDLDYLWNEQEKESNEVE